MNLQITVPVTWQSKNFDEWIEEIKNKLKKSRL